MMYSFLLVGQSNMAGRGFPSEVEKLPNKDIYVLRNGRWWPIYVPVNPDRVTAGINLSESFVYEFLKEHPGDTVGIIPCADGGTSLDQWMPGKVLFDHAVMMTSLALRSSTLAGILWHQGESDCGDDRHPLYQEKCTHILEQLRREVGCPDVPLLLGGLGDFLPLCEKSTKFINYVHVNAHLQAMARSMKNCAFVSAEGLGANPDNLHFSAAALREFGLRYYEAYKGLTPVRGEGKEANLAFSEIEKL
jgi:hypothetical protein